MFSNILDRLYLKRPQVLTAEKKTLTLVLPFLGELPLQTTTKLQKVLKRTLGCCKIQIVFKNQRSLSNVYKFQCGRYNASYYGEIDTHLKVR